MTLLAAAALATLAEHELRGAGGQLDSTALAKALDRDKLDARRIADAIAHAVRTGRIMKRDGLLVLPAAVPAVLPPPATTARRGRQRRAVGPAGDVRTRTGRTP